MYTVLEKCSNLGSFKTPPRMLTATSASSFCLPTSARGVWRRGRGVIGRGILQLGRGEVEEVEEAEEGEGQIELSKPSQSQPGTQRL